MSIKTALIAIVVAVVGLTGLGYWIYDTGYDNGANYVNTQVQLERDKWQQTINQLQSANDVQIATITENHRHQIAELNKQIETLKKNPQVITEYVPVTSNLTNGFVLLHDRAATNIPLYTMLPPNFESNKQSDYTTTDLANTITTNYNTCNQCIEKLTALQAIVKQYQQRQQTATGEK